MIESQGPGTTFAAPNPIPLKTWPTQQTNILSMSPALTMWTINASIAISAVRLHRPTSSANTTAAVIEIVPEAEPLPEYEETFGGWLQQQWDAFRIQVEAFTQRTQAVEQ